MLAKSIAAREVSSVETTKEFIGAIEKLNPQLNAVCFERFEPALAEAARADAQLAKSAVDKSQVLLGVPVSLKESFRLSETPATIGLTRRRSAIDSRDGQITKSLKASGAIVIAKTNVSIMMFSNETDNPVYGRTLNPWNPERTPGGSTGGEAALIAAGGSVLGFGGDMGGSIRVPCHFCGIHGLKPTNGRITRQGSVANVGGMKAFEFQPGPMARHVEDLATALNILSCNVAATDAPPSQPGDFTNVDMSKLRIGIWSDDLLFPVSPAIRRAITESAASLKDAGATVEPFVAPKFAEAIDLYMALMSSDGGIGLRSLGKGSEVDAGIKQLFRIGQIPRVIRPAIAAGLRAAGQHRMARLLSHTGARSAADFWRLSRLRNQFEAEYLDAMNRSKLDAIILPPYAIPAIRHGTATDLLMAGCYAYITNLIGLPAGVASLTRVRPGEETDRAPSRDSMDRLAIKAEEGSVGLPVGVQVAAKHWREDIVLAIMSHLESDFRLRDDYPLNITPLMS